jgi:hypothetical protein
MACRRSASHAQVGPTPDLSAEAQSHCGIPLGFSRVKPGINPTYAQKLP